MRSFAVKTASLLALLSTASARLLTDPQDVINETYDFIIVGAGIGGSVIASRLTETSNRVLLIEAGVKFAGQNENIPFFGPLLTPNQGPWDWNYTVAPQAAMNDRTFAYPRGKMLGGSSGVNYLVYNVGSLDYFNNMAQITGDDGWSWDALVPYMKKLEKFHPPADGHNTTDQFIPDVHGFDGNLLTTLPGYPTEIDNMVLNATTQVPGYEFNEDMNSGDQIGIGWVYASIGGKTPKRSSAATAYLLPAANRSNFDVLIETQVTRVLNTGVNGSQPEFKGVEFSAGPGASVFNLTATKEVILSAGSIGSPQILLLSGIGDSNDLSEVGIDAIVDLPEVGRNLQDHPLLPNQWLVNSNVSWEAANRNATLAAEFLEMYKTQGQGPLVNTICNHIGWHRIPENSSIWENETDPTSGPTTAHYELVFAPGFVGPIQTPPSEGAFMTVVTNLVSPASRGFLKLNTSSPWDHPIIDPAIYKENVDRLMMREAYKSARTFLSAPAFKDYIIAPYGNGTASTDEEIDEYMNALTTVVWHPVATVSMGNGTSGVVGADLRVNGINGLRVVDASVLPIVPPAHTEAPVYIIAERAADVIKSAWGLN